MFTKYSVLSAIVLASQLFSIYGLTIPAIQSAINFLSGAPNALTACNNYTTTCTPFSQMDGKYYVYKRTPIPSEHGLRCETTTYETVIPNTIGINTRYAVTNNGTFTYYFTYVSMKPGQLRAARLPNFLDFSTINIVYYNCTVGFVLVACWWNDNAPIKTAVVIFTTEPNPLPGKVQILLDKAEEQGLNTSTLVDMDHTNCPCETKEPFITKVLNIGILTLLHLLFQQVFA